MYSPIRLAKDSIGSSASEAGQAPTRVWYRRYSSLRSGTARPSTSCFKRRPIMRQRRTWAAQAAGTSDSTLILARTSSLRFVSCVEVDTSDSGHRSRRRAFFS